MSFLDGIMLHIMWHEAMALSLDDVPVGWYPHYALMLAIEEESGV